MGGRPTDHDQGQPRRALVSRMRCLTRGRRSSELYHRRLNCLKRSGKNAKLLFLLIAVVLATVSFVSVLGVNDKSKHEDERKNEVNLHPDLI